MSLNQFLPAPTREHYKVTGWPHPKKPRLHFGDWGTIDLRDITLKLAAALIQKGFPYLVEAIKKRKEVSPPPSDQ